MPRAARRVFISYSWDTPEHKARVLELADQLTREGLNCILDQYETHPSEPWPRWMDREIESADYVLVVCTKSYLRRATGREKAGTGRGTSFESILIIQDLYDAAMRNEKFIPVVFDPADSAFVPKPLRGYTLYHLDAPEGYNALYFRLTEQPGAVPPKLGIVRRRAVSPLPSRGPGIVSAAGPSKARPEGLKYEKPAASLAAGSGSSPTWNSRIGSHSRYFAVLALIVLSIVILTLLVSVHFRQQETKALEQLLELGVVLGEERGILFAEIGDSLDDLQFAQRIRLLRRVRRLRELRLRRLYAVTDLSPLRDLTKLEGLIAVTLPQVSDLDFLRGLPHLRRLALGDLGRLRDLTPLADLPQLEELALGPLKATDLTFLDGHLRLRHLTLNSLEGLRSLGAISKLSQLHTLELRYMRDLKDISSVRRIGQLRRLRLEALVSVNDLTPLSGLPNLEQLEVISLIQVEEISCLKRLSRLHSLQLSLLGNVRDLSALEQLDHVEHLVLWELTSVQNLSHLAGMANLKTLKVGGFAVALDPPLVQGLHRLQRLEIGHYVVLTEPESLGRLPDFRLLQFEGGLQVGLEDLRAFGSTGGPFPPAANGLRPPDPAPPAAEAGGRRLWPQRSVPLGRLYRSPSRPGLFSQRHFLSTQFRNHSQ